MPRFVFFFSILFFLNLIGISQQRDLCYHGAYKSGYDSIKFAFLFDEIESAHFDYELKAIYYSETKTPILFEEIYFCKKTAAGFFLCADSTKFDEYKIHGNFGSDQNITIANPQFLHYPSNETPVKMIACPVSSDVNNDSDERIVDATQINDIERTDYDDIEIIGYDEDIDSPPPVEGDYAIEETIPDIAINSTEDVAIIEAVNSDEDEIVDYAETEPSFPGGMDEMYIFLSKNIVYPPMAADAGIQGRVFVQFVVETDGTITGVKVVRGASPELDKEAVRVISSMPTWIPGTLHGRPVRVRYTLPVNFKL